VTRVIVAAAASAAACTIDLPSTYFSLCHTAAPEEEEDEEDPPLLLVELVLVVAFSIGNMIFPSSGSVVQALR
jgi:hypothetical protein